MKRIFHSIAAVILPVLMTSSSFCQSGAWISHPLLPGQAYDPIIRCGKTTGVLYQYQSGTVSFFDACRGAWHDCGLNQGADINGIEASGEVAFCFTSDSKLIAYSSLTGNFDSITFRGGKINNNNHLYNVNKQWALFATDKSMYIFDAVLGLWKTSDLSLPENFSYANVIPGDDYALLILYRQGEDLPKHYVYSLPQHAFNHLDYGPLPVENMGHGYTGVSTLSDISRRLAGYSAISNTYDFYNAPCGLGSLELSGPHHTGGSVFAYSYSEVTIPDIEYTTTLCFYSTLVGKWKVSTMKHSPYVGYGGLHVGAEYAQLMRISQVAPYTFSSDPLVYSAFSDSIKQFDINFINIEGNPYPPGGFILGKNVMAFIEGSKAWGYDARTHTGDTCSIKNYWLSDIFEGADFITFSRWQDGKDSMDLYIFDGNKQLNRWLHLTPANMQGSTVYAATDNLYAIYSHYPVSLRKEILVYSEPLGYSIQQELTKETDTYNCGGQGIISYFNTSDGQYIFDAQNLMTHKRYTSFLLSSDNISDSIVISYNSNQVFGYSAKQQKWADEPFTGNINYCKAGNMVGLILAGNQRERCLAYNGYHNAWVVLSPQKKSLAWGIGGNFAIVVQDSSAYGFYLHGTTGIGEKSNTLENGSAMIRNFPNPFSNTTRITCTLKERSFVTLSIYNTIGNQVAELANGTMPAGEYSYDWFPCNLPPGLYTGRLQTSHDILTTRMILSK